MQHGNSIMNEKSHVTNFLMCFSQSSENDLFKNFFNSKIEITVLIFNSILLHDVNFKYFKWDSDMYKLVNFL